MEEISLKTAEDDTNEVQHTSSDKLKKIILNTNGYCFLCSKFVESDTKNIKYPRKSVSLKSLHRYLQLNLKGLFNNSPQQSARSFIDYEELHVQICDYCDNLMSRFSDSFLTLEVIQMETSYWLEQIQKQISKTINQPELAEMSIADGLRKEIKEKSLKLKSSLQPKVLLSEEGTLPTSSTKATKTVKNNLVPVKVEEPDAPTSTHQNEETDSSNEASASSSSSPLPKSKANTKPNSNTGNRSLLPSQMYVKNSKTGTYDCIVCKKKFTLSGNAASHCKYTHFPQEYKCDLCGASYTRPEVVKKHMKICNGIKPSGVPRGSKTFFNEKTGKYTCVKCGKEFGNPTSARTHYESKHLQRTWPCGVCKTVFSRYSNYHAHKKTCRKRLAEKKERESNPKYKIACKVCGMKFAKRSVLIIHQKAVHLNERNYNCNICSKSFKRAEHLRNHKELSHFGRTFNCKLCKKKFTNKSLCQQHFQQCGKEKEEEDNNKEEEIKMYIKNPEDKTFGCPICKKKFRQVGNARRHYECVHIGKKNKCEDCGVSFPQMVTLINHKKKCNGGSNKQTETLESETT